MTSRASEHTVSLGSSRNQFRTRSSNVLLVELTFDAAASLSQTFSRACYTLGINLQPAHPDERTLGGYARRPRTA